MIKTKQNKTVKKTTNEIMVNSMFTILKNIVANINGTTVIGFDYRKTNGEVSTRNLVIGISYRNLLVKNTGNVNAVVKPRHWGFTKKGNSVIVYSGGNTYVQGLVNNDAVGAFKTFKTDCIISLRHNGNTYCLKG